MYTLIAISCDGVSVVRNYATSLNLARHTKQLTDMRVRHVLITMDEGVIFEHRRENKMPKNAKEIENEIAKAEVKRTLTDHEKLVISRVRYKC